MSLTLNKSSEVVQKNALLHYVNKDVLISSRKNILYISEDEGENWQKYLEIPIKFVNNLKVQTKLSRRLFRQYVYHVLIDKNFITVFGFNEIFIFSKTDKLLISRSPIVGSRPLVVTEYNGDFYYGEYTSNIERKEICLFKSTEDKTRFEEFYVFKNIRHIHSVQLDPFTKKLFIATGDNDDECFIGFLEGEKFIPLIQGDQQARGIQLLFTEKHIYYATDAPHERNYIYRIVRANNKIERLQEIGGPVFYGSQVKGMLFFSTVCEPSEVNNQKNVELWGSIDGIQWKCIQVFKKDLYPMKLFQYGQLMFPSGPGSENHLWFTTFATKKDQMIIKYPLKQIKKNL
ncbi:hypothetical protein [Brumimicrobium oceani]|uniref:Glycosyl hydrolase n=1 Tax=Brumimicrobium oceani TaxID=2100725 RepID=A0A2U2XF41_9FLAO|nr:hypothetical protein [Brumimicrobium oceani]PWH86418.1 hypothetical protein DIT68_04040 [Brumimicrobium oceani]